MVTKQTRDKRNGIFVYVVESLLAALTFLRCCCVILADLVISALFLDEIKSLPSKRKGLRGFLVAERNIEFERNETKRENVSSLIANAANDFASIAIKTPARRDIVTRISTEKTRIYRVLASCDSTSRETGTGKGCTGLRAILVILGTTPGKRSPLDGASFRVVLAGSSCAYYRGALFLRWSCRPLESSRLKQQRARTFPNHVSTIIYIYTRDYCIIKEEGPECSNRSDIVRNSFSPGSFAFVCIEYIKKIRGRRCI